VIATETRIVETMSPARRGGYSRMAFIDWTRGLGALIMLQGHVFHSFTSTDLRDKGAYALSQFVGGIAPAIFLFLTGVTLAFLMDGLQRKGAPGSHRFRASLKRAAFLLSLALLFRLQLWLFGWPQTQLADLLKVDILNCMALAIFVLSPFAFFTTAERARNGLLTGAAIAIASPVVSMIPASYLPELLHNYIAPDFNYFGFFPWAAFVVFGLAAGSMLRLVTSDQLQRVMQWTAIAGFITIFTAQYFSNIPYSFYPSVDFWLNSPGLIFCKLGIILVLLSLAYLWTRYAVGDRWNWICQLGTTSLLVYWVHIELVYGRWLGFWKQNLSYGQCGVIAAILVAAMVALSTASTRWNWKGLRSLFEMVTAPPQPQRVSGD
jgi:uncharacterized membrane protein